MGYFKEFDAIKKAKERYESDVNQLNKKLEEKNNVKFEVEDMEQRRKKQINELENKITKRKEKYQEDLKKGYKREFEKIKSSTTGYGESTATETETQLKHLEGKSKSEIKMKINEFKESGNNEGLRLLQNKMSKDKMPTVNTGYQPFEKSLSELDSYFKGKYRQTTSRIGEQNTVVGELKEELGLI